VEVAWPSGKTDHAEGVAADRTIIIKEGQGMIAGAAARGTGRD
jgi:hypothetical protein